MCLGAARQIHAIRTILQNDSGRQSTVGESLGESETCLATTTSVAYPRPVWVAVIVLLIVQAGLLAYAATRHSPTLNEPGHLVAGMRHWQFGQFELYRVNPPLSHMVAALPLLATDVKTDWNDFNDAPGARPVFNIGEDFITANGERSIWLFTLARWAGIPFSLLGGYFCFRWGSELYGNAAGLLALVLWCFSPNILAHAELVTPDMAATSLGITVSYAFWRWLKSPTWWGAVVAGLLLGLAELTKFTWVILFGLWPLLWVFWKLTHRRSDDSRQRWLPQGLQLMMQLVLAVYVINLGYGFEGSFTKLGDFKFVSALLQGTDGKESDSMNRFADTQWKNVPVPFPKDYVLGMDVQKRDFEDFASPSYLRGTFQQRGWWYYYVYAAAIKIPLGTWALIVLALVNSILARRRDDGSRFADTFVLLAPAVVVFVLVSSQTGFSHHFRYVLPCFPFLFVWVSQVANVFGRWSWKSGLVTAAVLWSVASSLWTYPHNLSYFNELAGGPMGGPAHLINSNVDWGQDLLHLKSWLKAHPDAKPLHLAYYGYYDPADLGLEYTAIPRKRPVDDNKQSSSEQFALKPGWYAVSVNYVRGYPWRAPQGAYADFQNFTPIAKAGYSIYIYKIDGDNTHAVE
ncbi:hypothetical protein Mal52_19100 [Symmachiella dynata]|uniref:Glycosyltransferase RgtA/B/C/D-like domain-containing protein n=1 Tax=Symmachiella dynata TaxID=2527995 RepID=A0A517ZLT3_9PLAN|nr:hypothetical protein Mal52_19100 [Symmachiella dynata]